MAISETPSRVVPSRTCVDLDEWLLYGNWLRTTSDHDVDDYTGIADDCWSRIHGCRRDIKVDRHILHSLLDARLCRSQSPDHEPLQVERNHR